MQTKLYKSAELANVRTKININNKVSICYKFVKYKINALFEII